MLLVRIYSNSLLVCVVTLLCAVVTSHSKQYRITPRMLSGSGEDTDGPGKQNACDVCEHTKSLSAFTIQGSGRSGVTLFRLTDACIQLRTNESKESYVIFVEALDEHLAPQGLSSPLQIEDGVWGPWPRRQPTLLESMPEWLSVARDNKKKDTLGPRSAGRSSHDERAVLYSPRTAILPWLSLKYTQYNLYHALDDLESAHHAFGAMVGSIRHQLSRCVSNLSDDRLHVPIVVMRQLKMLCKLQYRAGAAAPFSSLPSLTNVSGCPLEARLAMRVAGVSEMYGLPESEQSEQGSSRPVCFDEMWVLSEDQLIKDSRIDRCELEEFDYIKQWRRDIGLPLESDYSTAHITIIERLKSRHIANLDAVVKALRARGWAVTAVNLENLDIDQQFAVTQNSSTLIGYHGAGLAWSRLLPANAAEIQIIGFPCKFESHSSMHFRKRYDVVHAEWRVFFENQTEADEFCAAVRKKFNKSELTQSETDALGTHSIDVRAYDATVVDIADLIKTIQRLDPVINASLNAQA